MVRIHLSMRRTILRTHVLRGRGEERVNDDVIETDVMPQLDAEIKTLRRA